MVCLPTISTVNTHTNYSTYILHTVQLYSFSIIGEGGNELDGKGGESGSLLFFYSIPAIKNNVFLKI